MSPITWQNGTAGGTRLNATNLNLVETDIANAQTAANNAQSTANSATTAASNAQSTADSANTAASNAQATASAALPRWKASTAYTAGQLIINPSGDIVSANAGFTSGASYDGTKWGPAGSRIAAIEAKNTAQDTDITNAQTNAVASAKSYTDTKDSTNRSDWAAADAKIAPPKCVRFDGTSWVWDTTSAATNYVTPDQTGALIVRTTPQPVPAATPVFNW